MVRRHLIARDILDRSCRIRAEGEYLLIPVTRMVSEAVCGDFECLPEQKDLARFEHIGGIAIMQDDDPAGAADILSMRPGLHTVLYAESAVTGLFRTKQFRVLAGEDTTATEYIEYGRRFRIDLSVAYFSARLSGERQRILHLMNTGERVVDMFAGVGPFAITLAEKASVVFAGDINPDAVLLMTRNISLNRLRNVIPVLSDAIHLPDIIPGQAVRIIMNLPLDTIPFLAAAFRLCRPGGMIHLYALVSAEDECMNTIHAFPVRSVQPRFVRSYSPDRFHVVYDIIKGDDPVQDV
ncbi:MAG: methyltransferase [Methanospirillum sp.]|nr:methyltransferase [Methanospirillum sp.]